MCCKDSAPTPARIRWIDPLLFGSGGHVGDREVLTQGWGMLQGAVFYILFYRTWGIEIYAHAAAERFPSHLKWICNVSKSVWTESIELIFIQYQSEQHGSKIRSQEQIVFCVRRISNEDNGTIKGKKARELKVIGHLKSVKGILLCSKVSGCAYTPGYLLGASDANTLTIQHTIHIIKHLLFIKSCH